MLFFILNDSWFAFYIKSMAHPDLHLSSTRGQARPTFYTWCDLGRLGSGLLSALGRSFPLATVSAPMEGPAPVLLFFHSCGFCRETRAVALSRQKDPLLDNIQQQVPFRVLKEEQSVNLQ